jgi:hypothetical protein
MNATDKDAEIARQKKRRFRELARHDHIRTGRELLSELGQPFLPLINDCPADVQRRKAARPAWSVRRAQP